MTCTATDGPAAQCPHRAAPTVAEAAKVLLEALQDPDAYPGTSGIWQAAWDAMDEDHTENLDICGVSDWPSVMIAALRSVSGSAGDA